MSTVPINANPPATNADIIDSKRPTSLFLYKTIINLPSLVFVLFFNAKSAGQLI
nr:MAG TPA: hypothetical protein [Caudoviricetes sp.]